MRLTLLFRCLAGLAGALLLTSARAAPAAPAPLRVCLPDLEGLPYLNAPGQPPGLMERLMVEAGRRSGLPVQVSRVPIRRCLLQMRQGEIDGTVAGWNEANQQLGRFPMKGDSADPARRIVRLSVVWVQRRDAPLQWDGRRFSNAAGQPVTIGTLRAVAMVANALQLQGYRLEDSSASVHQLLLQLRGRRADAAVALDDQVRRELKTGGFDDLEMLPGTTTQHDFYVVVQRQRYDASPRLIESFWETLARLRESPAYQPR